MKRQVLLGLSALMIAGTSFAYEGTKSGSSYKGEAAACAAAKNNIPYDGYATSSCYCDAPENDNDKWVCQVDYRKESSSSRSSSSSSSSSSYSSGSSSYSSPSYTPTPSYGGSSGRFTPTQIPQRNPYVLSGQR
ncbi:hypothetical protein [Acinetobacter modestus]|uniref:hypothetical protein n=1 Tax=Acinetobacter modestus TaxID=1776740 RepID=UPI003208B7C7